MKKFVLLCFMVISCLSAIAQDIIVTKNAEKIEAKILEVSKSEIKYKKTNNLEGPTFIALTSDLQTIIYSNGDVQLFTDNSIEESAQDNENIVTQDTIYSLADWKGGILPRFSQQRVYVPGKKYKKWRYVGGNMVLKEKDFANLLELYCPDAYVYYKKEMAMAVCECCSILLGLLPVVIFAAIGMSYGSHILPTYNSSCATQPVELSIIEEEGDTEYSQNTPPLQ